MKLTLDELEAIALALKMATYSDDPETDRIIDRMEPLRERVAAEIKTRQSRPKARR